MVHHRSFSTREQAKREITEYIEIFYTRMRRQARICHLSPAASSLSSVNFLNRNLRVITVSATHNFSS
jgi:hypothetical protein